MVLDDSKRRVFTLYILKCDNWFTRFLVTFETVLSGGTSLQLICQPIMVSLMALIVANIVTSYSHMCCVKHFFVIRFC